MQPANVPFISPVAALPCGFFPDNTALQRITAAIYEQGGVIGAVCHGTAGLANVTLSQGGYLVAGRKVTAFTTEEEVAVGRQYAVAFLLDARLGERGALFSKAAEFKPHIVRDGQLITGQNPASATGVGKALGEIEVA